MTNYHSFISYIAHEKRYSAHTITAYTKDLEQFQDFLKQQYDIHTIQAADYTHIRGFMVFFIEKKYTTRSVNRKISTIKAYFKFLQIENPALTNPTEKIIAPKNAKRLPQIIEKTHLDQLFDSQIFAQNTFEVQRDRLVMTLLYATGIRRMELITLQTTDINAAARTLKVLGKRRKERLLPYNDFLDNALQSYLPLRNQMCDYTQKNLILTDKAQPAYPKLIHNIVHKYLGSVSTVAQRSPHIMRHSFATHLLDAGAELNPIKELLGHSSLAATQVYTHNSIEKMKKAYQQAHPRA
jgi:integrase/recombinase XerC